jgi:glycolate oxidase iron-sulfur subunit
MRKRNVVTVSSLQLLTRPIEGQKVFAAELPDYDFIRHCVRCARCLPVCPTYQETTLETQSPRGRLSLIKGVEDGKLPFETSVEEHLYHCLDCRMCNTVCPANVPIGEAIVAARAAFGERLGRPWWRKLVFEHILISADRLGWAISPMRIYQRLKLPFLIRPLLRLLPGQPSYFRRMEALLPALPPYALHKVLKVITPAQGKRKYRVGFFLGCMMSQLLAEESRATVNVLTRAGCEIITPKGQLCCGAPQDDQGERQHVRRFARKNIALFERIGEVDAILTDCAACSGMLKEYAELLHDDPEFAVRARLFSDKIKDIYEWYDAIGVAVGGDEGAATITVTLHDACHLANTQGIRQPQRNLLGRIKSVRVVEMQDPSACCGSAGIYNITHPTMADYRLQRKLDNIQATGASVVVTNGPGCLLQLRAAVRERNMNVRIKHISQLLEEAMGGG